MNELKTLRDIDISNSDLEEYNRIGPTPFFHKKLRAEAIKWIKELKENTWIKENAKFADDETGTNHTIAWIKHFFNITDDELSK